MYEGLSSLAQQFGGTIPPGQMLMGMNAGVRTHGPSGPRMNQA